MSIFLNLTCLTPSPSYSYLERLTHIIVENVHFFRVMDFLCALPYASGQESENKAMLMCGLDNLDESLGADGGDGGEVEESPLHIRINPLEYCFRKEVSAMMNSSTYDLIFFHQTNKAMTICFPLSLKQRLLNPGLFSLDRYVTFKRRPIQTLELTYSSFDTATFTLLDDLLKDGALHLVTLRLR